MEHILSFYLNDKPDRLREKFYVLEWPGDVATMLDVKYRDFNYWIYRTPKHKLYSTFHIPKKNGTSRRIDAPNTNIKILQQKLNQVLQSVYIPKRSVHGFVNGRNVKSNAIQHIQKRWVLNIDLEDFFPSINFGRVRGMFMAKPYNLPSQVATVLANLCCFNGHLPQGAPTSPVVSNMLCARLDSQLQQLAKANRSTYTRYADDMTFSTTTRSFPASLAVLDNLNQIRLGDSLRTTIENNGFLVNNDKTRLMRRHRRQAVTGVTVNEFPNLPRKFTNQIRAMLHAWRKYGLNAAQTDWETKYCDKPRAPWRKPPSFDQVLKGKIEYLGMIKGEQSMAYLRFLDELGELAPDLTHGRGTPLRLLLREYDNLANVSNNPQSRGYKLEELLTGLLEICQIRVTASFRRNDGGEQIDGGFETDGWYYLVECKWQSTTVNQQQIDGLSGKVRRSGAQTMGVLLSINGWSNNVVGLLKQETEKRILLMDGNDIRAVMSGDITFISLLQAKRDSLNLKAEPFLGVEEILQKKGH